MDETNQDGSEVLETTEADTDAAETTDADAEPKVELSQKELDDLKAKAAKADELEKKNKQLFERAKKQDKKAPDEVSQKDMLYLAKADIHEDDMDEVLDLARLKGISVKDAHAYLKPMLDVRTEERRSAAATQTRSPRGAQQASGEQLLATAETTGEIPDTEAGMQQLFRARHGLKK
jgi:hypothetical protein